MAQNKSVEDLLIDQMIIQLTLAGVDQRPTREIVGVGLERVARIAKLINSKKGE